MTGHAHGRILNKLARFHDRGEKLSAQREDPYRVLIACLLSLRTQDATTDAAASRLFARATEPASMLALRQATIAKLIYPVSFYRTKALRIRQISRILIDRYQGRVPDSIEALLELPGVGRKTANLTVIEGYGKPGICVDTHVHRISNRMGWVRTKEPDHTEAALRELLPLRLWNRVNDTLVRHGQKICKPISPLCSACVIESECPKAGVTRSR